MSSDPSVLLDVLQSAGVMGVVVVVLASGFIWAIKKLIATLEAIAERFLKQVLDRQDAIDSTMARVLTHLEATRH